MIVLMGDFSIFAASKKEVKSLSSQLHALLAQLDKERLSHRFGVLSCSLFTPIG